ncbi:GTP-binding protein [Utexia brackfieldae]|uniref:CobW family GTP-binding protein n=1 Tax=Utexia brackfieldae TaxID=3074108 RepID=UPI00370D7ACA
MTTQALLPVTILTGFLGAGKTTLINYLLTQDKTEKILIIENEFGPTNIDSQLFPSAQNIEVLEMTNGCICCSVQGELTTALHQLNQRRLAGTLHFDRLIIETTGLADPAPILQTFFIDTLIRETFEIDGIITLVDSEHILKQLDEHRVAHSQIGFADRLILTKTDRISTAQKETVLHRLATINRKATLFVAVKGEIPKAAWLDIHAFELTDELEMNKGFFVIDAQRPQSTHYQPLIQQPTSQHLSYNDDIRSYLFEAGELDIKTIGAFVETLIEQYGNDMLRYKGVLAIKDNPAKLIVQGVHKVVGFDYAALWQADEVPQSRFVVISRKLPFERLYQQFLDTEA